MLLSKGCQRTCVRSRCVSSRSYNRGASACEAGESTLRYSGRCNSRNAAADTNRCQAMRTVPFASSMSDFGLAVIPQVGIVSHGPVIHEAPRHRRENTALVVAVVGCHPWVSPDQLLVLGVHLADVLVVRFRTNVDGGDVL